MGWIQRFSRWARLVLDVRFWGEHGVRLESVDADGADSRHVGFDIVKTTHQLSDTVLTEIHPGAGGVSLSVADAWFIWQLKFSGGSSGLDREGS
jgi:hypothetical protein